MTRARAGADSTPTGGAPSGTGGAGADRLPRGAAPLALLAIVTLGAALRLIRPGSAPPGLNQDEAINAWNAWCLLRTGADMTGAAWPVFYSHAIGDNRTTLYFYALIPFQALGGLSVWTTRLPNALAGTAAISLIYWLGARLFDRSTGLVAALALAVMPSPLITKSTPTIVSGI